MEREAGNEGLQELRTREKGRRSGDRSIGSKRKTAMRYSILTRKYFDFVKGEMVIPLNVKLIVCSKFEFLTRVDVHKWFVCESCAQNFFSRAIRSLFCTTCTVPSKYAKPRYVY